MSVDIAEKCVLAGPHSFAQRELFKARVWYAELLRSLKNELAHAAEVEQRRTGVKVVQAAFERLWPSSSLAGCTSRPPRHCNIEFPTHRDDDHCARLLKMWPPTLVLLAWLGEERPELHQDTLNDMLTQLSHDSTASERLIHQLCNTDPTNPMCTVRSLQTLTSKLTRTC